MLPRSLVELVVDGEWRSPNHFKGGIPAEWGSLKNLKKLSMQYCGLDGALC